MEMCDHVDMTNPFTHGQVIFDGISQTIGPIQGISMSQNMAQMDSSDPNCLRSAIQYHFGCSHWRKYAGSANSPTLIHATVANAAKQFVQALHWGQYQSPKGE